MRQAILNAAARKNGALIRKDGNLIPRCECCDDCQCAVSPEDVSYLCAGKCTPVNWECLIDGVTVCDCTVMFAPPAAAVTVSAKGVGSVDDDYCLTGTGMNPPITGGPCIWGSQVRNPLAAHVTWNETCGPSDNCCVVTQACGASVVVFLLGDPAILFVGSFCVAEIHHGDTTTADALYFYGETPSPPVAQRGSSTYVFSNQLECEFIGDSGPFVGPPFALGHGGTAIVKPCCPVGF